MPRQPGVFWDKRAGCWATNALGEMRETATGRRYRPKSYARDLVHPTKDKRRAQDWLSEQLKAEESGKVSASDPTLDAVQEWYLEVAEAELGPEAYARRVEQLARVLDWPGADHPQRIGSRLAKDIDREDIRAFVDAMVAEGLSGSYVTNGLLAAIKRLMSWAAEVRPGRYPGLPVPNPLGKMKGPDVLRRAHRNLEAVAASRLVRFAWRRALQSEGLTRRFGQMTAILLWALHLTGSRPKEWCVAEWSDLKPAPEGWMILTLPVWKHKTGKKTGKDRKIAVPPELVRRLEWVRSLDGHHPDFVFTHRRGKVAGSSGDPAAGAPWAWVDHAARKVGDTKTLQRYVYRLVKEARAAGVDLPEGFRMYWLRSRYSTAAQRLGVPRALLAESMGTSERMLEVSYTDLGESDVLDAARRARGAAPPPES